MASTAELLCNGMNVFKESLVIVDAEPFITIVMREQFCALFILGTVNKLLAKAGDSNRNAIGARIK